MSMNPSMEHVRTISVSLTFVISIMTVQPMNVTTDETTELEAMLRLMPMVSTSFVTRLSTSPKDEESKLLRGMRLSLCDMSFRICLISFCDARLRLRLWISMSRAPTR